MSPSVGPRDHRRVDRRFERRIPIELTHEGATLAAETRNLSLGGVFIATDARLPYGARVQLRFQVPTLPQLIEVGGQVRWCDSTEGAEGLGIRFDGLRAREVWALNKFFAAG